MSALFLNICEIFAKHRKCYNSDIENEGQDQGEEELDLHYSTEYVRIHIDEFFSEFYLPDNIHLRKK